MNADFHIEKATLSQLEELVSLCRETFFQAYFAVNTPEDMQQYLDSHFSAGQIEEELHNPDSEYHCVIVEGQLAGYIKLNFGSAQSEMKTEKSGEIQRLYVLQKFQNLGLGAHLLTYALARAQERQLQFLWLGVWQENKAALRFYERNGFEIFGTHDFLFGTDLQRDWLMKRGV